MSLRLVTSFVNTNIPGAYPQILVQSQPVGLGLSGVVVIMGEADGGPGYNQAVLSNQLFTPDQLALVTQTYISGQIVDAFTALAAPSDDPNITGSANLVYIAKTNNGTKASSVIPTNYGTLSDSNWGVPGNLYNYQVVSVDAEDAPSVTGTTVPSYGATTGAMFTVRVDGSAAAVIGPLPASANLTALVANLNSAFATAAVDLSATTGSAPNTVVINWSATPGSVAPIPDSNAWGEGWGKSFELVDSTPGDLASLGLVAGLSVSSQEPVIDVNIIRPDVNVNQSIEISADIALQIGYQGTTATITITSSTISTTVTGGSGANLSIPLSQYTTIAELAAFIASQTGYSAVCPASSQQLPPSVLDHVSAIGIASTGAGLLPGRIKDAAHNFQTAIATSVLLFTVGVNGNAGLPAPMAMPVYLAGGTRGPTLAVDIVNVLSQIAGINVNFIVPLMSEDASLDIALGLTDPDSTYTIAAINAAVKSHCIQYSTPALKKNRTCILSLLGTYAAAKEQAQSLGNYRCSLTMQQISQLNSQGAVVTYQPWYAACLAAGMQAGGFYKSILNKAANIISFVDPSGFDSGDPGDVEDALSAGLLFLSQDTGRAGYWVSDQTTYGFDTNFVYNSIQAVYAADLIALDLAQSFFTQFVGQSLADVTAASALSFLTQKMAGYLKLKLIGSSSDAPLGFKNASIQINAPEMDVAVEIKLATAIYFIPITINVSQITGSASAG
jgi:hypothetical protein